MIPWTKTQIQLMSDVLLGLPEKLESLYYTWHYWCINACVMKWNELCQNEIEIDAFWIQTQIFQKVNVSIFQFECMYCDKIPSSISKKCFVRPDIVIRIYVYIYVFITYVPTIKHRGFTYALRELGTKKKYALCIGRKNWF